MITDKMTIAEIYNHWHKDEQTYLTKIRHEATAWRKICKKNPPKASISRLTEINSKHTRQDYYLLFAKDGISAIDHLYIFAKVFLGSKYNYYELVASPQGDDVIVYTSHYLDRYQERMKAVGDRKHVLCRYRKLNASYQLIHKHGKYSVYAMREGLALAISEVERTTFATFIPYDMLKPSQKAAFDRVRCVFEKDQQIVKQHRSKGFDDVSIITMLRAANFDIFDDAQTLYDLFYQEKIPTDMTADANVGRDEVLYVNPEFKKILKEFKV